MSTISHLPAQRRLELPLLRGLRTAEECLERFAPAGAIVLLLVFAVWAWFASRGIRLQFDELLEISAATAPTNRQVLSYLASGVDYNPPLSHFLVRASMWLFGNAEWASRLPAFLGVVALLVCLYAFMSRQLSRSYGIVAMLTILCLPVRDYAVQARPYGLVLGFSGLALVLYRCAEQRRKRVVALLGLAGCTAALVASHYYAILVIGVLLAAELARAWERKRVDWAILMCCAAPPAAILLLLRDALSQQRQQLTHYFSRGNVLSFDHGYDVLAMDPLVYCLALALIVGVLGLTLGTFPVRFEDRFQNESPLKSTVLGIGFLLLPIAGAFLSQFVTHAYVPRYFLAAAIGLAICVCNGASAFSRLVPGLVVLFDRPSHIRLQQGGGAGDPSSCRDVGLLRSMR